MVDQVHDEVWFARPPAKPPYTVAIRLHESRTYVSRASARPLLAAKHAWASRLLARAWAAERDNPAPLSFVD